MRLVSASKLCVNGKRFSQISVKSNCNLFSKIEMKMLHFANTQLFVFFNNHLYNLKQKKGPVSYGIFKHFVKHVTFSS